MAFIGKQPTPVPLTANDITDGIISTDKLADTSVTNAKLNADLISAETELATAPADTDEFLISDAGVLKRLDASLIGGGGKVLQVVTATDQTARSTTSTSFVTASNTLTVNITPSATSSKILILGSIQSQNNVSSGHTHRGTVYRDSTNIGNTNGFGLLGVYTPANTGGYIFANTPICFLDSPNTTSQVTYQYYIKIESGVGTIYINNQNTTSVLTCLEIGA